MTGINRGNKLSPDQVREIKYLISAGYTPTSVAKKWGLDQSTVSRMCSEELWTHIPWPIIEADKCHHVTIGGITRPHRIGRKDNKCPRTPLPGRLFCVYHLPVDKLPRYAHILERVQAGESVSDVALDLQIGYEYTRQIAAQWKTRERVARRLAERAALEAEG